MDFADRLKLLIGDKSLAAFSKKCGVKEGSIRQYLGGSVPGLDKVIAIAEAEGVSVDWLATGKGAKNADEQGTFVEIPVMKTKASAGGGAAVYLDEVGDYYPMSRLWLEKHRLRARDLFIIWGVGESMEPSIANGEKLLCSKAEYHLSGDGIFIIRQDGDLMVKRLQRLPGKIRVLPQNPAYQAYDVELNDGADFEIIGRVMFKDTIHRVD